MPANGLLNPIPSAPLVGVVTNPATNQYPDVSGQVVGMSRHGSIFADEVHGQYFAATVRGNVFTASAAAGTGRTILAAGGTTSGFMFYNPVGSGVNMEIIELDLSPTTATDVVGSLGLEYGAPPTTVSNADTVLSNFINGRALTAQCKASHGSTIVAMTFFKYLPVFIQTTAGVATGTWQFLFNGSLVLAPGGAINIISLTSQSTNVWAQAVTWAEWPV